MYIHIYIHVYIYMYLCIYIHIYVYIVKGTTPSWMAPEIIQDNGGDISWKKAVQIYLYL
jgi:hypothetical protein